MDNTVISIQTSASCAPAVATRSLLKLRFGTSKMLSRASVLLVTLFAAVDFNCGLTTHKTRAEPAIVGENIQSPAERAKLDSVTDFDKIDADYEVLGLKNASKTTCPDIA